jgi:hypothetical protein
MALIDVNSSLKRLKNTYRLVIMNEDSFEEVLKFKLTRLSVYIVFSTLLVLMVVFTTALIAFTPLKYYLPGINNQTGAVKAYRDLKIKTDSIENKLQKQDAYLKNIENILTGKILALDTTKLNLQNIQTTDSIYKANATKTK